MIVDLEREAGIAAELKRRNYPFTYERLNVADVMIRDVAVEVKRVDFGSNDYSSSIFDNRLYDQAKDRTQAGRSVVIVEMADQRALYKDITAAHWYNTRLSLILEFNSHVLVSESLQSTVNILIAIEQWYDSHEMPRVDVRYDKMPKSLRDQRTYFLSGLLNVGAKKAKELIETFGDPMNVLLWIMLHRFNAGPLTEKLTERTLAMLDKDLHGFGPKFFAQNKDLLWEGQ